MELIYSIDYKKHNKINDLLTEDKFICSLSCRNILAISRLNNDRHHYVVYEVCVFDLDRPWEEFHVCFLVDPVIHIKWNVNGSQLLIVTGDGAFSVWAMESNLINKWVRQAATSPSGQNVLAVAWLHSGIQVLFNPDKQFVVAYNEKFQKSMFKPTVSLFGGKHVDGWIAITSTAAVVVGLLYDSESWLITEQQCLSSDFVRLAKADVAFTAGGDVHVVMSDGCVNSAVKCIKVSISCDGNSCCIGVSAAASFYPRVQYEHLDTQAFHISNLQFLNQESGDVILVSCTSVGSSCLEVWQLSEHTLPLHRRFQTVNVPEMTCRSLCKWVNKASVSHSSVLTAVARPSLCVSSGHNFDMSTCLPYIACTYRDGAVKFVHRHTYQVLCTMSVDDVSPLHGPGKAACSEPYLASCLQSRTGCALVGHLHRGQIGVFRVFNAAGSQMQLPAGCVVQLVEHAMLSGHDVWDILAAVQQGMVENILQQIDGSFQKQSASVQEMLRMRWLRVRLALCNIIPSGRQRSAECHALLVLSSISLILQSLLRPVTITTLDKHPMEKLSALLSVSHELDLDNLLKGVDPDDYIIDSVKADKGAALQAVQPFVQWVSDFALHLLSVLPLVHAGVCVAGGALLADVRLLFTLRECLAVFRLWADLCPSCTPNFSTCAYADPVASVFRILSKLTLMVRDGNGGGCSDVEESLLDECAGLSSKIFIPDFRFTYGNESSAFAIFAQNSFPLCFTFGSVPDLMLNFGKRPADCFPAITPDTRQKRDAVRHINLGTCPNQPVRQCTRCGCLSLLRTASAPSQLINSWERRFVVECLCGGQWKLMTAGI